MVAEGIYNPVTGEVVKIQGAGTIYSEEKNSIALGDDTVAKGQDQFVFGRKNIEDDDKAEVVGGGSEESILETSYDYTNAEVGDVFKLVFGNQTQNPKWVNVIVLGKTLAEANQNITDGDVIAFVDSNTEEDVNIPAWCTPYLFGKCLNVEEGSTYSYMMICKNASDEVKATTTSRALVNKYAFAVYGTNGSIDLREISSIHQIVGGKKNIRTLDWNGNEKLAGNLELGGTLKIGSTTINEEQLQELLALITENES